MKKDLESLEDESETQETRNAIKALKELRSSSGWGYIVRIIEAQIKARTDYVMLTPRKDMDDKDMEFQRGEAAFGRFILTLIDSHIETLSAVKDVDNGK